MCQCEDKFNRKAAHFRLSSMALKRRVLKLSTLSDNWTGLPSRVVYKSWQPAKFAGFSARFHRLLSLLHKSKHVEEMDPQPSTFHKTPAT